MVTLAGGAPSDSATGGMRPGIVDGWLRARRRIGSEVVRALPPRARAPVRQLTVEQVEAVLGLPISGARSEPQLVGELGLSQAEGRQLVTSLVRRRLAQRQRAGRGAPAQVALTDRGRSVRDEVASAHRRVLAQFLDPMSTEQRTALGQVARLLAGLDLSGGQKQPGPAPGAQASALVTGLGDGAAVTGPEELVDRLLALRSWVERVLEGTEGAAMARLTLHQRELIALLPPEGLRMRDVAAGIGVSPATATSVADGMVRQSLAERRVDPADRRQVWLVPTAAATEMAQRVEAQRRRALDDLLERLAPDELECLQVLGGLFGHEDG